MKESGQTDKPASGLNKYLPQLLIIGMILLVYIQNLWFDFAYLDDNLIVFAEYEKIDSLSKIPQAFASGRSAPSAPSRSKSARSSWPRRRELGAEVMSVDYGMCRFALNPENRPQRFQRDSGTLNSRIIT